MVVEFSCRNQMGLTRTTLLPRPKENPADYFQVCGACFPAAVHPEVVDGFQAKTFGVRRHVAAFGRDDMSSSSKTHTYPTSPTTSGCTIPSSSGRQTAECVGHYRFPHRFEEVCGFFPPPGYYLHGGAIKLRPMNDQPACRGIRNVLNDGRRPKLRRLSTMKENMNPNDAPLSALLRAARPSPSLPPRFQENVWRRIEAGGAGAGSAGWLATLVALVMKPRFALAGAALLLLAGAWLGAHEGTQVVRQDAQGRYLAAVMPGSLR